jgi:hypothetical protein
MNLILKLLILSLISITLAHSGFSYSNAFVGNNVDQLPGIGTIEICDNNVDDDKDGLVDRDDSLDC